MKPKITEAFKKKAYKLGYSDKDIEMYREYADWVEFLEVSADGYYMFEKPKPYIKKLLGTETFMRAFIDASKGNNVEIKLADGRKVVIGRELTDEEAELWMDYKLNVKR